MSLPPNPRTRRAPLFLRDYEVGDRVDVLAFGMWCSGTVVVVADASVSVDAYYEGGEWEGVFYDARVYRINAQSPTSLRPAQDDARRTTGIRRR